MAWCAQSQQRRGEVKAAANHGCQSAQGQSLPSDKIHREGVCRGGGNSLSRRPKVGKSWLALDWGVATARGGFVFGDVHCKEGEVLYIALEDNERRLKRRITKLLGTDSEWPEKFEYATEWPRANEGGLDAIKTWIKSKEAPRLIVIDVLAAFRDRARGEKNVYVADYEAIKALQLIASELHVAILIVTHLRKAASDGDPQDKISRQPEWCDARRAWPRHYGHEPGRPFQSR